MRPKSVHVESVGEGFFCVGPVWEGVDRPYTGGTHVAEKYLARVKVAILSGLATPNARIATDIAGKTYVACDHVLIGKYINACLKKIGC